MPLNAMAVLARDAEAKLAAAAISLHDACTSTMCLVVAMTKHAAEQPAGGYLDGDVPKLPE